MLGGGGAFDGETLVLTFVELSKKISLRAKYGGSDQSIPRVRFVILNRVLFYLKIVGYENLFFFF